MNTFCVLYMNVIGKSFVTMFLKLFQGKMKLLKLIMTETPSNSVTNKRKLETLLKFIQTVLDLNVTVRP